MNHWIRNLLALCALVAFAACGGPQPLPTIAPNAEVTVDGLYRMDNTVMALAYAKPDLDLSPYTAFILEPVEVAYQKDPLGRRRSSPNENFALSESQMADLKRMFQEEVQEALTDGDGYRLVRDPAPNVAIISPYLIDLVVRVPTDRPGGRTDMYADSYGEVTMVVELRDSESNEILVRVGDRQDPTRSTYELAEVSTTFIRSDVTRLFRHWATTMRERLDQIRAVASN